MQGGFLVVGRERARYGGRNDFVGYNYLLYRFAFVRRSAVEDHRSNRTTVDALNGD
jgi:hypothetical protein